MLVVWLRCTSQSTVPTMLVVWLRCAQARALTWLTPTVSSEKPLDHTDAFTRTCQPERDTEVSTHRDGTEQERERRWHAGLAVGDAAARPPPPYLQPPCPEREDDGVLLGEVEHEGRAAQLLAVSHHAWRVAVSKPSRRRTAQCELMFCDHVCGSVSCGGNLHVEVVGEAVAEAGRRRLEALLHLQPERPPPSYRQRGHQYRHALAINAMAIIIRDGPCGGTAAGRPPRGTACGSCRATPTR